MFKPVKKEELNQISTTGMRAVVLLGLLIVAPRTFEEIKKIFLDLNIIEKTQSDDILRIDINTLKHMGCEISRADKKNNFKYTLLKHPFTLKFSDDELKVLKRAYKAVIQTANIQLLLEYDELFNKIIEHVEDGEIKEKMLGISILRHINVETVKELIVDCNKKRSLELVYKKPTSKHNENKKIIAEKIIIKNAKVYLYGYDIEKRRSTVLNLERIKSIVARLLVKDNFQRKIIKIKYQLKDKNINLNPEEETIVEETNDSYIIEGIYHNDFIATQRVLSFGSKCVVIEPIEFRNNIIEKIKEMRKSYEY